MPSRRRTHRKSRLGCQTCKRRHVKCDEKRPVCSQCLDSERACDFASADPVTNERSPLPSIQQRSPARQEHGLDIYNVRLSSCHTTSPQPSCTQDWSGPNLLSPDSLTLPTTDLSLDSSSASKQSSEDIVAQDLNLEHMRLFSHFIFETAPSISGSSSKSMMWRRTMPIITSTRYLIYHMLALSALHLSLLRPEEASWYREEAAALQTGALQHFTADLDTINMDNCVPIMVFTSFVGLYSLADAVIKSNLDAASFFDSYILYLDLHRGVRTVTSQSWALLRQSHIGPVLEEASSRLQAASGPNEDANDAFKALTEMLGNADMSAVSAGACHDALDHLRNVLRTEINNNADSLHSPPTADLIWTWPVVISPAFIHLLRLRRPEALVILSYYAALLHRYSSSWIVGDSGRLLVSFVTTSLGSFWKPWLEWPIRRIEWIDHKVA